jgi:dienelactone hydrolase
MINLFAAALMLFSLSAFAATPEKYPYSVDGKEYEGFILRAPTKAPAILMIHNWMGISRETEAQAQRFRALGYTVMAADVYGSGVRPANTSEAGRLAGNYKSNRPLFRKILVGALEQLKKEPNVDPNKIAVVGYCFGGTGALELARSGAEVKAVLTFHGGLDSPNPADGKNIKAKILVMHGADDPFVSKQDLAAFIQEMKSHHVDYTFVSYPGAVHSFTDKGAGNDNAKGAAYNASADQASFSKAAEFLKTVFH